LYFYQVFFIVVETTAFVSLVFIYCLSISLLKASISAVILRAVSILRRQHASACFSFLIVFFFAFVLAVSIAYFIHSSRKLPIMNPTGN